MDTESYVYYQRGLSTGGLALDIKSIAHVSDTKSGFVHRCFLRKCVYGYCKMVSII